MDVADYLRSLGSLMHLRGFAQSDTLFRFAATPVAGLPLPDPAATLSEASKPLAERSIFVPPVTLVATGLLLRRAIDPAGYAESVREVRNRLREAGFPVGRIGNTLAALLLRLSGRQDDPVVIERMKGILAGWKRDHRWLTGVDDLPLAVLHALKTEAPETIAARTQEAFQALKARGYWSTNELQFVAQTAALEPAGVAAMLRKFDLLLGAFRDRSVEIAPVRPTPVMLLALSDAAPVEAATAVADAHKTLLATPPAPFAAEAFSVATLLFLAGKPSPDPLALDAYTILFAATEGGCSDW